LAVRLEKAIGPLLPRALSVLGLALMLAACGVSTTSPSAVSQGSNATDGSQSAPQVSYPVFSSLQMTGPDTAFGLAALAPQTTLPAWNLGTMSTAPSPDVAFLATTDGGTRWRDLMPPDPVASGQMQMGSALYFLNARTGWFGFDLVSQHGPGSTVVVEHTTDGGRHWQLSGFASPYQGSLYLDFTNPSDGWVLSLSLPGAGQMAKAVFQTTDGGKTWRQVNCDRDRTSSSLPDDSYPDGISFNRARGFVTALYHGDPYVWVYGTVDGGHTFQRVQVPVPSAYRNDYANPYPPVFSGQVGSMFVQLVGQKSVLLVYRTTDFGATWRPSGGPPVPSSADLLTSWWSSPEDGYVLSSDGRDIYVTHDAGLTWKANSLPAGAASPLQGPQIITFYAKAHGLLYTKAASGEGALYTTTDGGEAWTRLVDQVLAH